MQKLEIRADGSTDLSSFYFKLTYNYFTGDTASPARPQVMSYCLPYSATDAQVAAGLMSLARIDEVSVQRSGYGGFTDYFGFFWEISFTGNNVAGNVQPLTVTWGTSSVSCANALSTLPSNIQVLISEETNIDAVGTDTEIQKIVVRADHLFAQGEMQFTFAGATTSMCRLECLCC